MGLPLMERVGGGLGESHQSYQGEEQAHDGRHGKALCTAEVQDVEIHHGQLSEGKEKQGEGPLSKYR